MMKLWCGRMNYEDKHKVGYITDIVDHRTSVSVFIDHDTPIEISIDHRMFQQIVESEGPVDKLKGRIIDYNIEDGYVEFLENSGYSIPDHVYGAFRPSK